MEESNTTSSVTETSESDVNPVQSSNQELDASGFDAETIQKLRGDAIGDTMYSERFVLKTLMYFSNLNWNDDVENDLCSLWDMTTESTVCDYLLQLSYPKLACNALLKYQNENRFIEIVIGIFANLLCSTNNCKDHINPDDIDVVFNLLKTDDPLILIQIMRFIHALLFIFPNNNNNMINATVLKQIGFILENSINQELIGHTLRVVASFTTKLKDNISILNDDLLSSVLIGYEQIIQVDNECNFDDDHTKNATKHFCEILCNFTYCAEYNQRLDRIEKCKERIVAIVATLLSYHTLNENILPVSNEFRFYIEAFAYIFKTLQCPFNANIVEYLIKILFTIKNQSSGDLNDCLELFCYLLTTMKESDTRFLNETEKLLTLLKFIEKQQLEYDFDYLDNIKTLLKYL